MGQVTLDPRGALGFRALLAHAAIHTGQHSARVIDSTTRAMQLLTDAAPGMKRLILQLPASAADDATVQAASEDMVWGLRLNVGFQATEWLVSRRVTEPEQLRFLLVLLREHMSPKHLFATARTDAEAVQLLTRARQALLAVSEYLKTLGRFNDSETFALYALEVRTAPHRTAPHRAVPPAALSCLA